MINQTFRYAGNSEESAANMVQEIALAQIKPSPENDLLYKPYDANDRQNQKLVEDIAADGVKSPLVLSLDFYIISGHRRYHSARRAGLTTVPCSFAPITRGWRLRASDEYIAVLRSHNLQRVKTLSEQLREELVDTDKTTAHAALVEARQEKSRHLQSVDFVTLEGEVKRSKISAVKDDMVRAILGAVEERRDFWPLSVRSIHYALLNAPPLRNCGSNPKFRKLYTNDDASYEDLTDLCLRLRLVGRLNWNSINDETRPFDMPTVDDSPASYFERQLYWFLRDYRRNLQQSQPHHIEIIGEKNTVRSTLMPIADKFTIPLTTARGFSSATPRLDISERYKRSGKDKLIILALTDFDPCGKEISESLVRSLRDDFKVPGAKLELLQVALTAEQIERFDLPYGAKAKAGDTKSAKFTARHGAFVWELEALPLPVLQSELETAIDSVLDVTAFNQEVEAEANDAAELDTKRQTVMLALQESA